MVLIIFTLTRAYPASSAPWCQPSGFHLLNRESRGITVHRSMLRPNPFAADTIAAFPRGLRRQL